MDSETRGSRRMLRTFWSIASLPITMSAPSSPTQTIVTWGLPSALTVTRCARRPDSITVRADAGISTMAIAPFCPDTIRWRGPMSTICATRRTGASTGGTKMQVDDAGPRRPVRPGAGQRRRRAGLADELHRADPATDHPARRAQHVRASLHVDLHRLRPG